MQKPDKLFQIKRKSSMHRLLLFLLCLILLTSCSSVVPPASSVAPASSSTAVPTSTSSGTPVAMLMTETMADTPYAQSSFENLSRAAGEIGLTSGSYLTPTADDSAVNSALELALTGGAELVVLFGEELAPAALQAARLYPQISFVLQEITLTDPLPSNVTQIEYSALQSGFLAGYIGIYQKPSDVGIVFSHDNEEESARYAYGFLLGADAAAEENYRQSAPLTVWPLYLSEESNTAASSFSTAGIDTELELNLQRRFTSFFNEADTSALLFASEPAWVLPALNAATGHDGRVALLLQDSDTASTHSAAAVQVQYNTQALLTELLQEWQFGRFPGGEPTVGTLHEGDIFPHESTWIDQFSYEKLLESFASPPPASQAELCLSLEDEDVLPPIESLELSRYQVYSPPTNQNTSQSQANLSTSSPLQATAQTTPSNTNSFAVSSQISSVSQNVLPPLSSSSASQVQSVSSFSASLATSSVSQITSVETPVSSTP